MASSGVAPELKEDDGGTMSKEASLLNVVWPVTSLQVPPAPELLATEDLSFGNMHLAIEWLIYAVDNMLVDYKEYTQRAHDANGSLVDRMKSLVEAVRSMPPPVVEAVEEETSPVTVEEAVEEEAECGEELDELPLDGSEAVYAPPETAESLPKPMDEGTQYSRVATPAAPPTRLMDPIAKDLEGLVSADKAASAAAELPEPEQDPKFLADMFRDIWAALDTKATLTEIESMEGRLLQNLADVENAVSAKNAEGNTQAEELREMMEKLDKTAQLALEKGRMAEGVVGSLREAMNRLNMQEERLQQIGEVIAAQEQMHQKLKTHGSSALEALLKIDMAEEVRRLRSHVEIIERDVSTNSRASLDVLRQKEQAAGGGINRLTEATASDTGLMQSMTSPKASISRVAHQHWGAARSAMTFTGNLHQHPLSKSSTVRLESRAQTIKLESQSVGGSTIKLDSKPSSREDSPTTEGEQPPLVGAFSTPTELAQSPTEMMTASTFNVFAGEDFEAIPEGSVPVDELENRFAYQRAEISEMLKVQVAMFEKAQSTMNKAVRDTQRETDLVKARVAHMWEEKYHVVSPVRRPGRSESRPGSRSQSTPSKRGQPPPEPAFPSLPDSLPPSMERAVLDIVQAEVLRTMESFSTTVASDLGDLLKEVNPDGAAIPGSALPSEPDGSSNMAATASSMAATTHSSGRFLLPASNTEDMPAVAAGMDSASLLQQSGTDPGSLTSAMSQLAEANASTIDRCKRLGVNQGRLAEALQKLQQSLAGQLTKHAAQLLSLSNRIDSWAAAIPPPGPLSFTSAPPPSRKRIPLQPPAMDRLTPFAKACLEEGRKGHENCKRQINTKSLEASKSLSRLPQLNQTKDYLSMH
mmetsp:Transcript_17663/g.40918  ORF Transcript_17663/g.40918 Transcript_17663/m.40918 type:complete len:869 (+) Transcript_17663:58-2664(+)